MADLFDKQATITLTFADWTVIMAKLEGRGLSEDGRDQLTLAKSHLNEQLTAALIEVLDMAEASNG